MNYYLDIACKTDAEMPLNRLLNMLYTKFHKALYSLSSDNIGVSFPKYYKILGDTLRIHATKEQLTKLQQLNWIGGLAGYCAVNHIQPIPTDVQYRNITRVQPAMSRSALRRLNKRGSISDSNINQYKAKMFTTGLESPYVELTGSSNGHRYRRYLQFGELLSKPIEGQFDLYGLSKTATVPWF